MRARAVRVQRDVRARWAGGATAIISTAALTFDPPCWLPPARSVIKSPLTTESAMKKIEDDNTLVFLVDSTANKRQIKAAVNQLYEIKAAKVRVGLGGGVKRGCAVLCNCGEHRFRRTAL